MRLNKIHCMTTLLVLLAGVPTAALATVGALATGSGNSIGWASDKTQAAANSTALKFCNQNNPRKDCKLVSVKAVVRAESDKRIAYATDRNSVAQAKKEAVALCGEKSCKPNLIITDPGFFSLAKSQQLADGGAVFHLAYAFDDSDAADRKAIARCKEESGAECTVTSYGVIPGRIDKPAAKPALARNPAENSCRPNTPTIRCSSQCTNGDCTVTYENGCRMRVQVQPRFDGFTNQWTYPAPSC
jgi:hypothetical protein